MKVRYYKLLSLLKQRKKTLEGLRRELRLLPTEIEKIETNRLIGIDTLHKICTYFECDTDDIMDFDPKGEDGLFYNARLLQSHSYIPPHMRKPRRKKDDAQ